MSSATIVEQIATRLDFSKRIRQEIEQQCESNDEGERDSLWKTIRSYITSMSQRWISSGADNYVELFEADCHDLWYIFVQAAKITAADSPLQDRLVAQILYARQLGSLHRTSDGKCLKTSNGVIWTDLPYLVGDLKQSWQSSYNSTTGDLKSCQNLAAFIARLVGLGVESEQLSVCALWIFRDALETPVLGVKEEAGSTKQTGELLSMLNIWLRYAGHQLVLQLTVEKKHITRSTQGEDSGGTESSVSQPLAAEAGKEEGDFNVARWKFWRERLLSLGENQSQDIRNYARRGAHMMWTCGTQVSSVLGESWEPSSPFLNHTQI